MNAPLNLRKHQYHTYVDLLAGGYTWRQHSHLSSTSSPRASLYSLTQGRVLDPQIVWQFLKLFRNLKCQFLQKWFHPAGNLILNAKFWRKFERNYSAQIHTSFILSSSRNYKMRYSHKKCKRGSSCGIGQCKSGLHIIGIWHKMFYY